MVQAWDKHARDANRSRRKSSHVCLQETSDELGRLLKSLKTSSSALNPVQAAVIRDAHR